MLEHTMSQLAMLLVALRQPLLLSRSHRRCRLRLLLSPSAVTAAVLLSPSPPWAAHLPTAEREALHWPQEHIPSPSAMLTVVPLPPLLYSRSHRRCRLRSLEERRVGKEGGSRWSPYH